MTCLTIVRINQFITLKNIFTAFSGHEFFLKIMHCGKVIEFISKFMCPPCGDITLTIIVFHFHYYFEGIFLCVAIQLPQIT